MSNIKKDKMQEYSVNLELETAFKNEILQNRAKNYENIFLNVRARQIIKHIKEYYDDELEFLWLNSPDSAIFRHHQNKKWYAVLMVINESKLGLKTNNKISIINLKAKPKSIDKLIDNICYFRAYHMNKKHWITIKLDEKIAMKDLCKLVSDSYQITYS